MIPQVRMQQLVDFLQQKRVCSIAEIAAYLQVSEATARRDISLLEKQGQVQRIRGGVRCVDNTKPSGYIPYDETIEAKCQMFIKEKEAIGRYAASLIKPYDLVYLDSGTSVLAMVQHIQEKHANYVTNSIPAAQFLAAQGFSVFVTGGIYKSDTQSLIGAQAWESIDHFCFTKGFFGTNGIDQLRGFSTPDWQESFIKEHCANASREIYVLADASKFQKSSHVYFLAYDEAIVITDNSLPEELRGDSVVVVEVEA